MNDMRFEIIGLDIANSTIKGCSANKTINYKNTVKQIKGNIAFSFKKTDFYNYEGKTYEIGNPMADGSGGRTVNRYASANFKIEAILAISQLVSNGADVRVVTGIPSSLSTNGEVIETIENQLLGSHRVKIGNRTIRFNITEVMVVSQPTGTLFDLLQNTDGSFKNKDLMESKAFILDIGFGTTDMSVLYDGELRSSSGFDVGVSDYILACQDAINTEYPNSNVYQVPRHELDNQLRNNLIKTPFGEFDVSLITAEERKDFANSIYQRVMGLGLQFNEYDKIILTGGGALLLEEELRELFNDERYEIKKDAQISNARGFFIFGANNWSEEMFEEEPKTETLEEEILF